MLKVPALEDRICQLEKVVMKGVDMLRKSMIQNFVCLEFNKDLADLL
jgi:hypothetical protein